CWPAQRTSELCDFLVHLGGVARRHLCPVEPGIAPMTQYLSTRGGSGGQSFDSVLLAGLAPDGGLFVPESWPQLDQTRIAALASRSYADAASVVMRPFLDPGADGDEFGRLVRDAYARFSHQAVTPLVQLDSQLWLLELFHGPTLAFKDVALQLLGRLFDSTLN